MLNFGVGVMPGKFCPPHMAHLNPIVLGASQCQTLYVVVSDNSERCLKRCKAAGIPYMDLKLRADWMIEALKDIPNIKVRILGDYGSSSA